MLLVASMVALLIGCASKIPDKSTSTTVPEQTIPTEIIPTDTSPGTSENIDQAKSPVPSVSTEKTPTAGTTTILTSTIPRIGNCQIFPADNPWNTDISKYPINSNSTNYIASIGSSGHLHADFGGEGQYGIPYITVSSNPKVPVHFTAYGDESDPGPYPIPKNVPIEEGADSDGDRHVIAVDTQACMLYELYRAFPTVSGWDADAGAKFNLKSNILRPDGWTSTDAAGLPIFPGLVRYDEVKAGKINHALRFTVRKTQKGFIHPATHYASSSTSPNLPPMGLRLRLKANYDISKYTGQSRVVLEALKKYGMIVADNGSNWYITGGADPGWNDTDLNQLKNVPGSAFEVVDTGKILK